MSNTVACETLDAMWLVRGAHCATWVGQVAQGHKEFTLDCYDPEHEQRHVVHRFVRQRLCAIILFGLYD